MGNPRGFLDFKRVELIKLEPEERIKNYKEFSELPSNKFVIAVPKVRLTLCAFSLVLFIFYHQKRNSFLFFLLIKQMHIIDIH